MRKIPIIVAVTTVLIVFSFNSTASDPISPNPDGSYSVGTDFLNFLYRADVGAKISGYMVGTGGPSPQYNLIFEEITLSQFSPTKEPRMEENVVVAEGQYAKLEVHNNPHSTIVLETFSSNMISLRMAADVGAINSGKWAMIGDENTKAEIIYHGTSSIEKMEQNLYLQMNQGDRFFFRSPLQEGYIGDEIASGLIVGELYLSTRDSSSFQDVVKYQPVEMRTIFFSKDKVQIGVRGSFEDGRIVIVGLERTAFEVPAGDLAVKVDGDSIQREELLSKLFQSGNTKYTILQDERSTEIFLRLYSAESILTIERNVPLGPGLDLVVGSLGAIAVVVVASTYLFRRRD